MGLRMLPPPALSGHLFSLVGQRVFKLRSLCGSSIEKKLTTMGRRFYHLTRSNIRYSANDYGASISCSSGIEKESHVSSDIPLQDACILYCVAPATGHNKELHPESNLRVLAIVNALERLELPSKAMSRASDEGIISINGSGPTYATDTTFQESLIAAGDEFPWLIWCYDAHVLDPLAGLQFTTGTYYMLATNIKQLAKELCGGRCVFFLEGGYLSNSVLDSFCAFLGEPSLASHFDDPAILYEEPLSKAKQAIQKVKHIHSL